jgi:hypothetical protein
LHRSYFHVKSFEIKLVTDGSKVTWAWQEQGGKSRGEQRRAEEGRTEQRRAEQSRGEQNRAEESRTERRRGEGEGEGEEVTQARCVTRGALAA